MRDTRGLIGLLVIVATIAFCCVLGWRESERRADDTLAAVAAAMAEKRDEHAAALDLLAAEVKGKDRVIEMLGRQIADLSDQLQECRFGPGQGK